MVWRDEERFPIEVVRAVVDRSQQVAFLERAITAFEQRIEPVEIDWRRFRGSRWWLCRGRRRHRRTRIRLGDATRDRKRQRQRGYRADCATHHVTVRPG